MDCLTKKKYREFLNTLKQSEYVVLYDVISRIHLIAEMLAYNEDIPITRIYHKISENTIEFYEIDMCEPTTKGLIKKMIINDL